MAKHKYISLDDAIKLLRKAETGYRKTMVSQVRADMIAHCIKLICELPAADVVEVVRCKDCIHAPLPKSDYGKEIKWPKIELIFDDTTCPYYCEDSYYSRRPLPDWFCCHGERREDDAED